jgi:hypothetical protein
MKTKYTPLFQHMANEHNLTLIESEMEDICQVVLEMRCGRRAGDSVKLIPSHKDNRPTTVRSAGPETVVLEEPRGGYQCWNNADIEPHDQAERPEAEK